MIGKSWRHGYAALLVALALAINAPLQKSLAAGLTPSGAASLATTTSSARVALPNTDATIVLWNTGTAEAFFKIGTVAVTAATTDNSLPAGAVIAVDKGGSANTNLAAITASGSTTIRIIQGAGLPALGAGSSVVGGGGGGDASAANQTSQITQETAINTVLGAKADAKSTATDTTAISTMSVLKQISASVQAPPSQAVTLGATQNTNLANTESYTSRLLSSATNVTAGSALATTSLMVGARYLSTPPTFTNGQEGGLQIDSAGRLITSGVVTNAGTFAVQDSALAGSAAIIPTATSTNAITPVPSTSAESNHVLKSGAGNLYGLSVVTGASAGYVMVFNATSAPSDGAVTPVLCYGSLPATSSLGISFQIPAAFSTGITVVFSTGASCFSKTASATAFFSGSVK